MQPEAKLGHKIRDALEAQGVFVFKVHGSAMMMVGLPDLIGCWQGRFIALEVKMPGNKPSPRQEYVRKMIQNAGGISEVVYSVEEALDVLATVREVR